MGGLKGPSVYVGTSGGVPVQEPQLSTVNAESLNLLTLNPKPQGLELRSQVPPSSTGVHKPSRASTRKCEPPKQTQGLGQEEAGTGDA